MFRLTKDEVEYVRSWSQFATLNKRRGSNIKYLSFAFTELGVAMLSSVLNSDFYNPRITKKSKPPLISEGFFFT
ncbi:MAG: ORF6N domain-containing protein [Bacteroidaceae bacterium]|nr:ORF6N domain-containing protein [Bacteroidaceae bacterium]